MKNNCKIQNLKSQMIKIGIADLKVSTDKTVITTSSLGSCIAIILYAPTTKIGGLAHAMLPASSLVKAKSNPAKCVDTAIKEMLKDLLKKGAQKKMLKAYIIGGASMFSSLSPYSQDKIGKRNVEAARDILRKEGIRVAGEDTDGNYNRSVEFSISTGEVLVKSIKYGVKRL